MRYDWGIVLCLFAELDLGTEASGGKTHFDCSFGHALEGVAAGFGWWAFVGEVAQDGRCC